MIPAGSVGNIGGNGDKTGVVGSSQLKLVVLVRGEVVLSLGVVTGDGSTSRMS